MYWYVCVRAQKKNLEEYEIDMKIVHETAKRHTQFVSDGCETPLVI